MPKDDLNYMRYKIAPHLQFNKSHFAMAFWRLPRYKRKALAIIYAFCRAVDDIADEPIAQKNLTIHAINSNLYQTNIVLIKSNELLAWRRLINDIYEHIESEQSNHHLNSSLSLKTQASNLPANTLQLPEIEGLENFNQILYQVIIEFNLPKQAFDAILNGMYSDVYHQPFKHTCCLELYCWQVAGAVGWLCTYIFAHEPKKTLETNTQELLKNYAKHMGFSLQLINMLRDIEEDANQQRCYLNLNTLNKQTYANMANQQYEFSQNLFKQLKPNMQKQQKAAQAMGIIYKQVLKNLMANHYQKQKLSVLQKIRLVYKVWFSL